MVPACPTLALDARETPFFTATAAHQAPATEDSAERKGLRFPFAQSRLGAGIPGRLALSNPPLVQPLPLPAPSAEGTNRKRPVGEPSPVSRGVDGVTTVWRAVHLPTPFCVGSTSLQPLAFYFTSPQMPPSLQLF